MENKVSDLHFDDKNFNRGTEYGKSLIDKSFSKFGAGRSILIDKNNNIIAGNKSTETFAEHGLESVKIVETDGKTLVAVKRTDIDLNTPEGREFALADNQTAKVNIDFDFDVVADELGAEVVEEWGLDASPALGATEGNFDDDSIEDNNQYGVIVRCMDGVEQEKVFNWLTSEGHECKIVVT